MYGSHAKRPLQAINGLIILSRHFWRAKVGATGHYQVWTERLSDCHMQHWIKGPFVIQSMWQWHARLFALPKLCFEGLRQLLRFVEPVERNARWSLHIHVGILCLHMQFCAHPRFRHLNPTTSSASHASIRNNCVGLFLLHQRILRINAVHAQL